jgi:hypothetical protein
VDLLFASPLEVPTVQTGIKILARTCETDDSVGQWVRCPDGNSIKVYAKNSKDFGKIQFFKDAR